MEDQRARLQRRLKEIDDDVRRHNRRLSMLSAGCYTAGAIGLALARYEWWLVAVVVAFAIQQVIAAVRS